MSVYTENIGIIRVIAHSIPKGSGISSDLVLSSSCFSLDDQSKTELKERIVQLLNSKSLQFDFVPSGKNAAFINIRSAICAENDEVFVRESQELAKKLNEASKHPRIPQCLMIVIQATTVGGLEKRNALFILRAEPQTGFQKEITQRGNQSTVSLKLINELFLSKSQKMLKIASVVTPCQSSENPIEGRAENQFTCLAYDENYELGRVSSSAKYFTGDFLGCVIPENAKKKTYDFFKNTLDFINNCNDIKDENKVPIIGALHSLLNSENDCISVEDFSLHFLPKNKRKEYEEKLSSCLAGETTIPKDVSLIKSDLKKNYIEFINGVCLRCNDMTDLEIIDSLEQDDCTIVKIRSKVKKLR